MRSPGRVAHVVTTADFAGVERYVCDTATGLAARGWEVVVVGGDPAAMGSRLSGQVQHRAGATLRSATRALVSSGRFDIVHAHLTASEVVALAATRLRGGRLVATRHIAGPRGTSALGAVARPILARSLDLQIAISRYTADVIGEPSIVIHNGVPPSALGAVDRERTVLMIQRLEPEKGTATGLRAWAASGLAADGWRLVVAGSGSQEGALRRLARELGVHDSVDFLGFVHDAREVIARAGILLAPSPVEGFGLSVVEAMAEGTPVVAAGAGGHPETVGSDGMLFDPDSPEQGAEQLRQLARDDAARSAYGAALRQRHRDLFTLERHLDGLETAYRGILGR